LPFTFATMRPSRTRASSLPGGAATFATSAPSASSSRIDPIGTRSRPDSNVKSSSAGVAYASIELNNRPARIAS
jgi:hypothetical protein